MRHPIYNSEILSVVKEIAAQDPRERRWECIEWDVVAPASGAGVEVSLRVQNGKVGREFQGRIVSREIPSMAPWEDMTMFFDRLQSAVDAMLDEVSPPPLPTFRIATRGKRRLQMRRAA